MFELNIEAEILKNQVTIMDALSEFVGNANHKYEHIRDRIEISENLIRKCEFEERDKDRFFKLYRGGIL